jgi:hypothetical protein
MALSRTSRLTFAAAAVLLALALAGRLTHWLPDFAIGFSLGMGLVLLAAALMSMRRGCEDKYGTAAGKRYLREFLPPMAVYALVMMFWGEVLKRADTVPLRILVALLPALLVLLALRAIVRYVRASDEFVRRIELEAIAIGALSASALYVTAGFLQAAQVIHVRADLAMLMVFPSICLSYGIAKAAVARHYA